MIDAGSAQIYSTLKVYMHRRVFPDLHGIHRSPPQLCLGGMQRINLDNHDRTGRRRAVDSELLTHLNLDPTIDLLFAQFFLAIILSSRTLFLVGTPWFPERVS